MIDPLEELSKQVEKDGSQLALAKRMGISPAYLSDVLNGRCNVGEKVLMFLGLKVTYERERAASLPPMDVPHDSRRARARRDRARNRASA